MEFKEKLIKLFNEFNINLNEQNADDFCKFKTMLLDWNEKINLTTITEENEIIIKHFLDSISIMKFIDLNDKKVVDVGTGAGFPGVPLKILNSNMSITLLDSLNKRITYLKEVVNSLNLTKVELIHGRAEDFGLNKSYREKYDICLSRAVANLSTLSEYCLPFVKVGGYFVSQKGPEYEEELNAAKNAIKILGGEIEKIEKVNLPESDINHSIIFIKKLRQTPSVYPRKAGKPSKEPLE